MTGLGNMLEQLGLSQYLQAFLNEGFDSWNILMDITESDLEALQVKLGHRRVRAAPPSQLKTYDSYTPAKLQRAIIDARGKTNDNVALGVSVQLGPREELCRSEEESGASARDLRKQTTSSGSGNPGGQKRKYRRHPRPDEYAPERPPSAYVIFSNQMRDQLKGQDLSFTEIAKIVGERWQVLSTQEKEPCERQAQAMKEKYYADLTEYKKTPQYSQYQEYLSEFKAKQSQQNQQQQQDNKRPKSEQDGRGSPRNDSQDRGLHARKSPSSPRNTYDWRRSVSPTYHTRKHISSPIADGRSPASTSPNVSNFRRFPPRRPSEESTYSQDSKRQALPLHPLSVQSSGRKSISHDPISPVASYNQSGAYEGGYAASQHQLRNKESISSLAREDNAKASPSPYPPASQFKPQLYNLPAIDSSKPNTSRVLPLPLPPAGSINGLINARPLESSSSASRQSSQSRGGAAETPETRSSSSIATLLRAGEQIDRDAAERKAADSTVRPRVWE